MSLARSQWISLVAATIPTITAALLWTTPLIPDTSHWLAITATAVTGLLWSIAAHVFIVVGCHRETRRLLAATVDGLAESLVGRVLDESYNQIVDKILQHREMVDDLAAARRNFCHLIDPDTAPIDLAQWRTERAIDTTAHHGTAHR